MITIRELLLVVDIEDVGAGDAVIRALAEKTEGGEDAARVLPVRGRVESAAALDGIGSAIGEMRNRVEDTVDRMSMTVLYLFQAQGYAPASVLAWWIARVREAAKSVFMRDVRHVVCWLVDEINRPIPSFSGQIWTMQKALWEDEKEGGLVLLLSELDADGRATGANRYDAIGALSVLLAAKKVTGKGLATLSFRKLQVTEAEARRIARFLIVQQMECWDVGRSPEVLAQEYGVCLDARSLTQLVQNWEECRARYAPVLPDSFDEAKAFAEEMWAQDARDASRVARSHVARWEKQCRKKGRHERDIRVLLSLFGEEGVYESALREALEGVETRLEAGWRAWTQLGEPLRRRMEAAERHSLRCMKVCAEQYSALRELMYLRAALLEMQQARERMQAYVHAQHRRRMDALASLYGIDERRMSGYRRMAEALVRDLEQAVERLTVASMAEVEWYYPAQEEALLSVCALVVEDYARHLFEGGTVTRDLVGSLERMDQPVFEREISAMLDLSERDRMLNTGAWQPKNATGYIMHSNRLDGRMKAWTKGRPQARFLSARGYDNAEHLSIHWFCDDLNFANLRGKIPLLSLAAQQSLEEQEKAWPPEAVGAGTGQQEDGNAAGGAEQEGSPQGHDNPWAARVERVEGSFVLRMSWADRNVTSVRLENRGFALRGGSPCPKESQHQTWEREEYNLSSERDISALVLYGHNTIAIYDQDRLLGQCTFLGRQQHIDYSIRRGGRIGVEDAVFTRYHVFLDQEDADIMAERPLVQVRDGDALLCMPLARPRHALGGRSVFNIYAPEGAAVSIHPAHGHNGVFAFEQSGD